MLSRCRVLSRSPPVSRTSPSPPTLGLSLPSSAPTQYPDRDFGGEPSQAESPARGLQQALCSVSLPDLPAHGCFAALNPEFLHGFLLR